MAVAEAKPSLVERLFADHRGALQAFFLRRIRAKADAADLAQEVYVRMLRISDQDAIRNPVHYLYTVANNLVKEHAVLDRRHASGIDIDEAPRTSSSRRCRIRRGPRCEAAGRASRGRAQAAASEMPRRGGAALHAGTLLPGDRDAPRGVPADGEEVRRAGLKSLSTPHGGARLKP